MKRLINLSKKLKPKIMQMISAVQETLYKRVERLMGNRFEISIVSDNEQYACNLVESAISEIRRIEKLLTTFNDKSQTNLINSNAGVKPVKVDREVFDLIFRSLKISQLTQGAFD